MTSLLKYMSGYLKESILAPLFKFLEACFDLFVPLIVASMIDLGVRTSDKSHILLCAGALVVIAIFGLLTAFTAQYYAAKAAIGFGSQLRRRLISHINKLSFSQIDAFGADSLATRITSDASQVQSGVNLVLRRFMRSPLMVVGATIMALFVDVKAGLVFVLTLPILALLVFGIMCGAIPAYRKCQRRLDELARATRETLFGARVIRAFNLEDAERRAFEESNNGYAKLQRFAGGLSSLMNPSTYVVVNLAIVALLWTGSARVEVGDLTQGQAVALLNYMSQIVVELVKLASLAIQTTKSIACGARIAEVLNTTPDMTDGTVEARARREGTAVAFHNVTFSYAGAAAPALENVSFEARVGEKIGIIGGSGSGKTTLVNLIARFYEATDGNVEVFGGDVRDYTSQSLRSLIALVPQKAELFKGTLAENLRWGAPDATDAELWRALELAQASDFVAARPEGLAWKIEQNGRNLSGGQKQRLTVARGLVRNAPILILDDSSSALDFTTESRLRAALRQALPETTTTFIITQRASSILRADQIVVLDDGKIVGRGVHSELLESNEVYREIFYSQFPAEDQDSFQFEEGALS